MNIRDIRVQKLFAIALVLKVIASGLGWYLQSPWLLGFALPLFIMGLYIVLGIYRRDSDVSDDKFADSAYYLGFIFTITSIIFSLFDLPNIGTRIQDIAVRFGAAMVSTVLGLGVRVYLVSFRADVSDAIRDAEDALLGATRAFTERLTMSLERLQDFESRVDLAARSSVERVNLQVEALSKNHAEQLTGFFTELTTQNREVLAKALDEVGGASSRLSASVDEYAKSMNAHLGSIETRVTAFAAAVTARLQNTTFPDDYFAKRLAAPLEQLELAASEVVRRVSGAGEEMSKSASVLSGSLHVVMEKSGAAESAMDSILRLAGQQHRVLETSQGQLDVLAELAAKLEGFEALLTGLNAELRAGHEANASLGRQVSSMVGESAESRSAVANTLSNVARQLESHATASAALADRMSASIATSERVSEQLGKSATVHTEAATQLATFADVARQMQARGDAMADAEQAVAHGLQSLNERALRIEASLSEATRSWQLISERAGPLTSTLTELVERVTSPSHASPVLPSVQVSREVGAADGVRATAIETTPPTGPASIPGHINGDPDNQVQGQHAMSGAPLASIALTQVAPDTSRGSTV